MKPVSSTTACAILTYLFTITLPHLSAQNVSDTEYVPGIFKQNLTSQSPIYYNTYAPILLEYKIPKFDVPALTLTPHYSAFDFCKKPIFNKVCPPTFFIQDLVSGTFSGNFTPWNTLPVPIAPGSLHRTIDSPNFCDELTQHFIDFKVSAHNIETYMSKLVECSVGNMASVTRNIQEKDHNLKRFYANFTASVERTFYDQTDAQTDDVAALNAHTANYAIFLVNNLMESQRWVNAMSDCRAGQVPSTLVSAQKLTAILTDIERKATRVNYKLSIPTNVLVKYYKLPLTDCVLTDSGSLLVRILVPLVENTAKYEHIRVEALPFLKSEAEVCSASKISDKTVVFEHASGQILDSPNFHCKANELCQLPRYTSDWPFSVNHCLSSFLLSRRDDVAAHCHLECLPYSNAPIFRTVNSFTVVVTGTFLNNRTISVQCDGKPEEILNINSHYPTNSSVGALRIHLPCHCRLNYNQKTVFKSGSIHYCSPLTVTHILPYAWQEEHNDTNNTSASDTNIIEDTTTIRDDYFDGFSVYGHDYTYPTDYDNAAHPSESEPNTAANNADNNTPANCTVPGVDTGLTGLLYLLCGLVLLIVGSLCFICFKLIQIEKWRRHHESEGDKHPIMTYHVFNDQQDILARNY